jgi:sec-independent protein translocase protein TatB
MSGVGFWELVLLFMIGLIVLGPERLPRVANQLGTWLGQARRMSRVLKRQLEDELNLEKDLNFRPRPAPKVLPPAPAPTATPTPEHDDTYSPAHAADSPGTGVPSAMPTEEAPAVDEQSSDAAAPDERMGETEGGDNRATAVGNSKT